MAEIDKGFYDRADAHIHLWNDPTDEVTRGKVSASMIADARFSAWVSAISFHSAEEMQAHRAENVAYFVKKFRLMLEEDYSDYAGNFDRYMA